MQQLHVSLSKTLVTARKHDTDEKKLSVDYLINQKPLVRFDYGNPPDFIELSPLSSSSQERTAAKLHGPEIDR